jgi:hypothetical protein
MRQADGRTREETIMRWTRRRAWALGTLALVAIAGFAPTSLWAQTYPNRPVHLIVPFAAGGSADVVARGLAQGLGEAWGHQVVVENKPGANTQIAAEFVAKSTPDGYTLLLGSEGTFVMNPFLYGKLPYDPARDFVPITALVAINQVLAVNPSVPVHTIGELVALAKRSPATLSYGTTGFGSASHLNMEQLDRMAGIKTVAVHYRGSGPALADVIAGHVPLTRVDRARLRADEGGAGAARRGGEPHPLLRAARRADDRRKRIARLRRHVVVRPVRARRHRPGDRRPDQRRRAESVRRSGVPRALPATERAGAARDLAGGIRRRDLERGRQMGRDHPGRQPEGELRRVRHCGRQALFVSMAAAAQCRTP